MIKKTISALALAATVSGCVTVSDSENIVIQTPPATRLTDWQAQYHGHSWQHPSRVCYREVINNRGFAVVRELNCQGRILKETRRYNRY